MTPDEKPLNVPLYTEPFDRFKARTKRYEIRNLKRGWTPKHVRTGRRVRLMRGYNPKNGVLEGTVGRVVVAERYSDFPDDVKVGANIKGAPTTYFDPSAFCIAFEVVLP